MATSKRSASSSKSNTKDNRYSSSSSAAKPKSSARKSSSAGPGRGWHGDPEGHARAGRQSHKRDAKNRQG